MRVRANVNDHYAGEDYKTGEEYDVSDDVGKGLLQRERQSGMNFTPNFTQIEDGVEPEPAPEGGADTARYRHDSIVVGHKPAAEGSEPESDAETSGEGSGPVAEGEAPEAEGDAKGAASEGAADAEAKGDAAE